MFLLPCAKHQHLTQALETTGLVRIQLLLLQLHYVMFNPQLGRELIISLDVAKAKAYGTYRVEQSVPLSISPSTKNLFVESVPKTHLSWT
jgi:hypothetical protein